MRIVASMLCETFFSSVCHLLSCSATFRALTDVKTIAHCMKRSASLLPQVLV